jgi:hypothetical protein
MAASTLHFVQITTINIHMHRLEKRRGMSADQMGVYNAARPGKTVVVGGIGNTNATL